MPHAVSALRESYRLRLQLQLLSNLLHEKYFFSRCFSLDCVFYLTIMSSESLIVDYPYR